MKRDWQRGRAEAGDSRWVGDRDRDEGLGLAAPSHGLPNWEMPNANQDLGGPGMQPWVGCPRGCGTRLGGDHGGWGCWLSCRCPQKLAGRQESALPCLNPHACRSAVAVWKGVIEGTAHAGQVRVTASESYRALAAEAARTARLSKERMLKKVLGQGHVPCAGAVGAAVLPWLTLPAGH